MHFSIPDTQDVKDETGSAYTSFNVHINGVFHCTVRYSLLHSFHEQLKKEFGSTVLPPFPPKKFLPLSNPKLDERRIMLEKYIQLVSQEVAIASSDVFNNFLLNAQQETQKEQPENASLDVFLMNGHKITLNVISIDQTEEILEAVASQIELPDDFVYYFGLFLVKKEDDGDNSIVRKLQDFESPYISLKSANAFGVHRIVLRKSYWDSAYDDDLLDNKVAMNLLYVQAWSDIDRKWIQVATKDQMKHLNTLQQRGSKREVLRLARTLKHYGFMQFNGCITDYPQPHSSAIVAAGNRELNFKIQVSPDNVQEGVFKITRIRCWRITTTITEGDDQPMAKQAGLELSFEYLMAKDCLQWITVKSHQAILMSMCLQGMVEELIMKKQGKKIKKPQDRVKRNRKTLQRDTSIPSGLTRQSSNEEEVVPAHKPTKPSKPLIKMTTPVIRTATKLSELRISKGRGAQNGEAVTNTAFDAAIGDDDL